jgi:hypothetical protein
MKRVNFTKKHAVLLPMLIWAVAGCAIARKNVDSEVSGLSSREVLNLLKDDLNAHYGFRDGVPRINLGPCGRFARDFFERWNARFPVPATIAFVMSKSGAECHHVVVKFSDGTYYDGGNGLMTETYLLSLFPGSHTEEMKSFDLELLDKRSYGLGRQYPVCPNYSDKLTQQAIDTRLDQLLKTRSSRATQ